MTKRIPSSRDSPLKKSLIDKLDEIIEIPKTTTNLISKGFEWGKVYACGCTRLGKIWAMCENHDSEMRARGEQW